jgi:curved DNA-binding protein CbpA
MGPLRSKLERPSARGHASGERPRVAVPAGRGLPVPDDYDDADAATELEIGEAEIDLDGIALQMLEMGESEIDASLGGLELDLSAEQQLRIGNVFARLYAVDFYALLVVPRMADTKTVKRAYNERISELHPDRFFRKRLGTFQRKLDSIFIRMTEARDVLCSPVHRARYDELLRMRRASLVDALVDEAVAEIAATRKQPNQEHVDFDRSVRVPSDRAAPSPSPSPSPPAPHPSGVQAAAPVITPEETVRLRDLHDCRKRAGRLEQGDRERYDVLRERFAGAFLADQHVDLPPGHTYRSALRVPCSFRLTLSTEGRVIDVNYSCRSATTILAGDPHGFGCRRQAAGSSSSSCSSSIAWSFG